MDWWIWVLGGLVLLLAEVLTPGGFFVVFFGAGAILVGALKLLGWSGPGWAEWLVFTVLSVASLALFRRPLMRRFSLGGKSKPVDRLEGETAIVTEDVAPGSVGKAEMRGASWTARSSGTIGLARGQRCRVERVEGLTLWLRAE
jgi:membrane protein implicated in regulation of membrane protease activity